MIRLNLSPEPAWLDLGGGVRLRLAPLTSALTRAWERGAGTTVNIYARDAESFRASRAQVASDIARAVAYGRRSS
jgi:hypothetical protein